MNPPHCAAPLWRRVFAFFYDLLALIGLWVFIGLIAVGINGGLAVVGWPRMLLLYPVLWLATGAYFVLSWRYGGQTLGMRPWRLVVRRANGGGLNHGHAWLRYACGWLSALPAGAGMLVCLFDAEKRALHDRWVKTRVDLLPKHA